MCVASHCGADGLDVAEMPCSRVCVEAGFEVILVLRDNKKRRVLRFRANSGSLSRGKGWNNSEGSILPAIMKLRNTGRFTCHEADQLLPSVKRNKHANRNKGTRTSARPSARKKNRKVWWWTKRKKCVRCANLPKPKPRCSASVLMTTNLILTNYPFRTAPKPLIARRVGRFAGAQSSGDPNFLNKS